MIKEKHSTGSYILFNPEYHSYSLDNVQLRSVTTFINKFFPKFDMELISKRYAKKHNLDQEQVKADWKQQGKQATDLGNNCHNYVEALINGTPSPKVTNKKEKDYFNSIKFYLKKFFLNGYEPIKTEYIIASKEFKLGGTIDLLLKKDKTIYIRDWKTNKTINTYNTFQDAKEPISHLDDCLFNKYSLQLNFYKYILHYEKYFKGYNFDMSILHVVKDDVIEMPVADMTKDVKKMLKF